MNLTSKFKDEKDIQRKGSVGNAEWELIESLEIVSKTHRAKVLRLSSEKVKWMIK